MSKKLILIIAAVLILAFGASQSLKSNNIKTKTETKEVHYHAGFLLYIDGKLRDFSDSKYMDIEPCNDKSKPHKEDEQLEKAHLHDNIGDVVHVHRENAVWGDLFKNIRYTLPKSDEFHAFVNGIDEFNIFSRPIKAYDSAILIYGNTNNIDVDHYVTKEHIQEVEKKSETCGTD